MTTRQLQRAKDKHPQVAAPKPQAVVWSVLGNDRDTVISVAILTKKGAAVTVKTLDNNAANQTAFAAAFPDKKTSLPQIIVDGTVIGGYKDLIKNATYSTISAPKATIPSSTVVQPTKFGKGSGTSSVAKGSSLRSSITAPKKK